MSIALFCLVKGNSTANAFEVDIKKDKSISKLKEAIKAQKPNGFAGVDSNKLKLWKVTIPDDRDDLLSKLSLNDGDELLATKKISKYFPDSPAEEHIHVLVEPPVSDELSGSEFYEPPNKRVKTVDEEVKDEKVKDEKVKNEKMKNFWQVLKNASLTGKFLKLPQNTKFFGKTNRGHSILYIRKCYEDLQRVVFDDKIQYLRISGNPGIGKTIFGYYLLYLLAKKNATIVYDSHKEKKPIVFDGENAFKRNADEIDSYLDDEDVWYIVDGKEPEDVDAKTILLCSTKRSQYKNFDAYDGEGTIRYMPIWSWKEIKMCRKHIYKDISKELARELFSKWGGIPRCVLKKANDIAYQNKLEGAINSCKEDVFDDIGESSAERTLASHMVIHVHVNLPVKYDKEVDKDELSQYSETQLQLDRNGITTYTKTILRFASNYVRERVTERLETLIRERLVEQIKAGVGSSLLGSSFEYIAHKMLRNGGNFDVRPLNKYINENFDDPDAKINLPQQELSSYFRRNNIGEIKDGVYYQAWEKNFPSLDSVITPNKVFQMTIAKVHPIKMSGLKALYNKFDANKLIYYYFVVPEHLYDDYKVQKFVNSDDDDAKIIPEWINNRVFQYVLKIKL